MGGRHIHVRYEDLVEDPEKWMGEIYGYIGVPFERETIEYGEQGSMEQAKGLGDPIGVGEHTRPSAGSVTKWVEELSGDSAKRRLMEGIIGQLDPDDLKTIGYPLEELWAPLDGAGGTAVVPRRQPMTRYRLQRKLIVGLRTFVGKSNLSRRMLERVRLACDVLLRS